MVDLTHEQKWNAISLGAAVVAAVIVRQGIRATWKITHDDDPPLNPLREDTTWSDALLFSVATGLTVGLARMGARAVAASALRGERSLNPSDWIR